MRTFSMAENEILIPQEIVRVTGESQPYGQDTRDMILNYFIITGRRISEMPGCL